MKTNSINQKSNSKAKDRLRAIVSAVSAFLLSLFLVSFTVLLVIQWSGFSRSSFYGNMSKNNYYDYVMEDIHAEAESVTLPVGLPLTVFDNLFTSYGVSRDVNGYIDASFKGETYVADTQEMKDSLEENVRAYLKDAAIVPNAEQEANLQEYITTIVSVYKDKVRMPLLTSFVKARNFYNQIFVVGIIASAVGAILCMFLIIRLHRWLHRSLRYLTYATIATGLMVGIVPLFILQSGFYKRIHLSPEYFYNFFTDYVTNILKSFINFSVVWLVVSALIIAFITALKKNMQYTRRS